MTQDIVEQLLFQADSGDMGRAPDPTCTLRRAAATITKLRERLELTGEFANGPDGIACRDDTIKLQDARIAALREENARLREALSAIHIVTPEHNDWCDVENCVCYFYPAQKLARAALGGRTDG